MQHTGKDSLSVMRLGSICILAFVLMATTRSLSHAQDNEGGSGILRGTVMNALTRGPIGRALVFSNDNRYAAFTNGEGQFEFSLPSTEAGTMFLSARKPGFINEPNESSMVQGFPGREVILSLLPEGLIAGRVTLGSSEAAFRVRVQLFSRQVQDGLLRWRLAASVQTNSNGEFRFAELLPGAYKVTTTELVDLDPVNSVQGGQDYAYPPVYYPNATDFDAASTIQLTAGQAFQADIPLTRRAYYTVEIPIAFADPLAGANISVSPRSHRGPGYSLGYDAQKHEIAGELPDGEYLVEAVSYGQNPANGSASLTVAGGPAHGPAVVLNADAAITLNVREEFTAAETNSGASAGVRSGPKSAPQGPRSYLSASLEPVDDFEARGGAAVRPPRGPNDESLLMENVLPGRYYLRLYSSKGYASSVTMGGADLLNRPFVVGSGSTAIEITMRDDWAELAGKVSGIKSPRENPQAGLAWVYCIPLAESSGVLQQLSVQADGGFDISMIPPGVYRVIAFKSPQPNLPFRDVEGMKAYENKGQVIHLTAGQKAEVQLQVQASE